MHEELIRQLRVRLDQLKREDPARYHALEAKIRGILQAGNPPSASSGANPSPRHFSRARFERLVARLKQRSDVKNPYALARAIEAGRVRR